MRVFALQAFDEIGELRCNRARLSAVLPGLGREGVEAAIAIAERPVQ